jgi:uncharacterized protein YjbI with pentapeptide repeats
MNAPSGQYHQPVLEALCAFVRDNAKATDATDIQAALTVIGRRTVGPGHVDLTGADLSRADLKSRADLQYADLNRAILRGTILSRADLTFADLDGALLNRAKLNGALLIGAKLRGAVLFDADLSGAELASADLNGALLGSANLTGAHLVDAIVSQDQLNQACGVDTDLRPGLTIKPCPPPPDTPATGDGSSQK